MHTLTHIVVFLILISYGYTDNVKHIIDKKIVRDLSKSIKQNNEIQLKVETNYSEINSKNINSNSNESTNLILANNWSKVFSDIIGENGVKIHINLNNQTVIYYNVTSIKQFGSLLLFRFEGKNAINSTFAVNAKNVLTIETQHHKK